MRKLFHCPVQQKHILKANTVLKSTSKNPRRDDEETNQKKEVEVDRSYAKETT